MIHATGGIYIVGYRGAFGVGKTLSALEHLVKFADARKLRIVSNIYINPFALRRYARAIGCCWVAAGIPTPVIIENDLLKLFSYENSVILLDEAGDALFSRNFKNTSHEFFARLFRLRHYNQYLLFTCQSEEQIDKQLREMCHLWMVCGGLSKPNRKTGRQHLHARWCFRLLPNSFQKWQESTQAQGNFFRMMLLSGFRYTFSVLLFVKLWREFLGVFSFSKRLLKNWSIAWMQSKGKGRKDAPRIIWSFCSFIESIPGSWRNWRDYQFRPCDEEYLFQCFYSFSSDKDRKRSPLLEPSRFNSGELVPEVPKKVKVKSKSKSKVINL